MTQCFCSPKICYVRGMQSMIRKKKVFMWKIQNSIHHIFIPVSRSCLQLTRYALLNFRVCARRNTRGGMNIKKPNFEHPEPWRIELWNIWTSHLSPKPNFELLERHQKLNCLRTLLIKKWDQFFSKYVIKTELRTCTNMWFWPKTELRTSRTSPKTKQFANIELFVPPLQNTIPTIWQILNHFPRNLRWAQDLKIGMYVWWGKKLRVFNFSPYQRSKSIASTAGHFVHSITLLMLLS